MAARLLAHGRAAQPTVGRKSHVAAAQVWLTVRAIAEKLPEPYSQNVDVTVLRDPSTSRIRNWCCAARNDARSDGRSGAYAHGQRA